MCTRSLEEARERAGLGRAERVGSQVGGVAVAGIALSHQYPGPNGEVSVLEGATFEVPAGGYAALVVPQGQARPPCLP